jgi:hypothetical protein
MKPRQIENFFRVFASELAAPATVYLTGACAAALWGGVRPSQDIDFGLRLPPRSKTTWAHVYAAVERSTVATGIPASVAEDIDRWGMITLLDYQATSKSYTTFGKLDVRLLEPAHWAIGKLTRFLEPDIIDIVTVFKRRKVMPLPALDLWGRALRSSPPSTAHYQFRRNVETFVGLHGRAAWGAKFSVATAIAAFHAAAKIVEAT